MVSIAIPSDIIVTLEDGSEKPFSFAGGFIKQTILRDRQWGVSTDMLYCAMDIRTVFEHAEPGTSVQLSEDQHKRLCEVVKQPSDPYNPFVMIHGKAFLDAILKAK